MNSLSITALSTGKGELKITDKEELKEFLRTKKNKKFRITIVEISENNGSQSYFFGMVVPKMVELARKEGQSMLDDDVSAFLVNEFNQDTGYNISLDSQLFPWNELVEFCKQQAAILFDYNWKDE